MAPMRQQPITDESWTEGEAIQLVRALAGSKRKQQADGAGDTRHAVLTRTVEDEVIPRLLMARRPQKIARAASESRHADAEQVARLTELVIGATQTEATAFVEAIRDGGASIENLFLELLSPTARRLGAMWEDDTCSFSDVTIGLLRLGNVMRLLSRAFAGDYDPKRAGPSALLAQMPGEQHGFGLAMVVHFFRRAGWNVRQEPVTTSADLIGLVQNNWFGLVGLSVACSDRIESLAADIRAIRKHSRNRSIGIMVGGPPFIAHPQLATMVGADATAADGRQAVGQAQSLVSLLARGQ